MVGCSVPSVVGFTYRPRSGRCRTRPAGEPSTEVQVASPPARRPYGFRHTGVSWRLSAGTAATLVAEWAGHTVEVLYRIYAHCLDGDDERWFTRMEQALG